MMERAVATLSPELLQFGSDRFLPCPGSAVREAIAAAYIGLDELLHDREAETETADAGAGTEKKKGWFKRLIG